MLALSEYAATPDPVPARRVKITPDKVAAAMRAFFRLGETWELTSEQGRILLGQPARSTYYRWKRGDVRTVPHDTVQRVSYLLGIYKALQILFKDRGQAAGWVRKPSAALGGQSALDRMLGGDVTDLAAVRRYLDAVRGQGA
jgi:hypothetical protein